MAIYKSCPRCNTLYEVGSVCPRGCQQKVKRESNKVYDETQRKNADIYHSKEWKVLRIICLNNFDNLCLWSLFKYKRIVRAELIHHIIEVEEDRTKAFDVNNLIPVSDEAHREIHELYKTDKTAIQSELLDMKRKYLELSFEG